MAIVTEGTLLAAAVAVSSGALFVSTAPEPLDLTQLGIAFIHDAAGIITALSLFLTAGLSAFNVVQTWKGNKDRVVHQDATTTTLTAVVKNTDGLASALARVTGEKERKEGVIEGAAAATKVEQARAAGLAEGKTV